MRSNPLSKWLSRRRKNALVALDLGVTAVKAIHVRRDGADLVLDGFRIVRYGRSDGGRSLAQACREALDLRLEDEPVALAVSSPGAAIRKIELPPMSGDELRQALPWEAQRHITGLAEDAMVDAQVLSSGSGGGPMEILLVAFPRDHYARIESLCSELALDPEFVDVRQLATMNSLSFRPAAPRSAVALLDLGSALGFFSIFSPSSVELFRDLSPRLARLNTLLGARFSLDADQVDALKLSGKLADGQSPAAGAIEKALSELVAELVEDLRSGLVYFENHTGGSLDRVYLTGGNAIFLDRYGIADALSTQSGVAIERYNPFQGLRLGLIDEIGLKATYSELCAAAGVARRFFASD